MEDGCKVYMESYVASNGSRFMVTWIIFEHHILQVCRTQILGDHVTWNLTNVELLYFLMCEDLTWIEVRWNSIWLTAQSHMTSCYTWGPVATLHDFGSVVGRPLDTFFWALIISWSRLLGRVYSGPSHMRLRARDHYTSNALISGKGGANPSSLHTMLEGPTE